MFFLVLVAVERVVDVGKFLGGVELYGSRAAAAFGSLKLRHHENAPWNRSAGEHLHYRVRDSQRQVLAAAKAGSYLRDAVSYFVYAVKARYDYIFGDFDSVPFQNRHSSDRHSVVGADYCLRKSPAAHEKLFHSAFSRNAPEFSVADIIVAEIHVIFSGDLPYNINAFLGKCITFYSSNHVDIFHIVVCDNVTDDFFKSGGVVESDLCAAGVLRSDGDHRKPVRPCVQNYTPDGILVLDGFVVYYNRVGYIVVDQVKDRFLALFVNGVPEKLRRSGVYKQPGIAGSKAFCKCCYESVIGRLVYFRSAKRHNCFSVKHRKSPLQIHDVVTPGI